MYYEYPKKKIMKCCTNWYQRWKAAGQVKERVTSIKNVWQQVIIGWGWAWYPELSLLRSE